MFVEQYRSCVVRLAEYSLGATDLLSKLVDQIYIIVKRF